MKLEQLVNSKYSHVVSVEPAQDGTATLYTRESDTVTTQIIPFKPFILINNENLLDGFFADEDITYTHLKGSAPLSTLVSFSDSEQKIELTKNLVELDSKVIILKEYVNK